MVYKVARKGSIRSILQTGLTPETAKQKMGAFPKAQAKGLTCKLHCCTRPEVFDPRRTTTAVWNSNQMLEIRKFDFGEIGKEKTILLFHARYEKEGRSRPAIDF